MRVGLDIGFGFVKATDGRNSIIFPSVMGAAREIRYRSELANLPRLDSLIVELGGTTHFVGNLALRQSDTVLATLSESRLGDREAAVLSATAMALLARDSVEPGKLQVVTGLPVSEYARHKEQVRQSLSGRHLVRLVGLDGRREEVLLEVAGVKVMPQPFGSLFDAILDERGKPVDRMLAGGRVAVVDVGFRTTDYAVSDALEFVDRLSDSTQTALSVAYRAVARALKESYGIDRQPYELDGEVRRGCVRLGGREIDISQAVRQALEGVAQTVRSEAETLWRGRLREFDAILVTGGGGEILRPHLEGLLPETMRCLPAAQFANVRGYLKLAHRTWGNTA